MKALEFLKRLQSQVWAQTQVKQMMDYMGKFTSPDNYRCAVCDIPVGMKGSSPAIQIGTRSDKVYKHSTCEGRIHATN